MPYIDKESRSALSPGIAQLLDELGKVEDPLVKAGSLNYVITKLLLGAFPVRRYGLMALVDGILAGVGREYYRRRMVPYEIKKIEENGDVY